MRVTTLLRDANPLPTPETELSIRARAELRALVGPDPAGDEVTAGQPSRRRRMIRVLIPIGATLAVVAVFAIPLLNKERAVVPAVPAGSPAPTGQRGQWVQTAPSPLDGRRDAITAWVGDSFLVIGGTTAAPCFDVGFCEESTVLSDGARYTPATNTWAPIADAPIPLELSGGAANPDPRAAVIKDQVYVLYLGDFLAYDNAADRWSKLPAPPKGAILAGATGDELVAYPASACRDDGNCDGADFTTYYTYDPAGAVWASHTAEIGLSSSVYGISVVGSRLVVSWLEGDGLGVATIDLTSGAVNAQAGVGVSQRPVPIAVGEWAAWPRDDTTAWLLNTRTGDWRTVDVPSESGAFQATFGAWQRDLWISGAGMASLGGQLFDPVTGLWSVPAPLPVPAQEPIIAGGAESFLACGGWDGARFGSSCYTLVPEPATLPIP